MILLTEPVRCIFNLIPSFLSFLIQPVHKIVTLDRNFLFIRVLDVFIHVLDWGQHHVFLFEFTLYEMLSFFFILHSLNSDLDIRKMGYVEFLLDILLIAWLEFHGLILPELLFLLALPSELISKGKIQLFTDRVLLFIAQVIACWSFFKSFILFYKFINLI